MNASSFCKIFSFTKQSLLLQWIVFHTTKRVTYFHLKTRITINEWCRDPLFSSSSYSYTLSFWHNRWHLLMAFQPCPMVHHERFKEFLPLLSSTSACNRANEWDPYFSRRLGMMSGHVLFRCSFLRFFCFLPCHKYDDKIS